MKLHENKSLFQQAVFATAQQKGLPTIYIEKDYWVTMALFTIFMSPGQRRGRGKQCDRRP